MENNVLKVRTLFSGIGSPEAALKKNGVNYELVDFCEIDKYAVKSYCAIHGADESKNLGDISKVWGRNLPYADLLVWGFPCTDISVAGKQAGIVEGATRSGLYYEGLRILRETKPKYSIIENVKNLTGKKFKAEFEQMLQDINELGYNNYWKVLNAKDYGIPQNRERVFIVSIRKDVDNGFEFPQGFDNGLRLKDFLEDKVDEKFFLSKKMFDYAFNINKEAKGIGFSDGVDKSYINPDVAQTIGCRSAADQRSGTTNYVSNEINGKLSVEDMKNKIAIKEATKLGYAIAGEGDSINIQFPDSETRRGRVGVGVGVANTLETSCNQAVLVSDKPVLVGGVGDINFGKQYRQGNRIYDSEAVAMCLLAQPVGNAGGNSYLYKVDYRIRKLTPKECWRLMGFSDEDFQRAADAGVSNSQLYKQAGNSIVVHVMAVILNNLLGEKYGQA